MFLNISGGLFGLTDLYHPSTAVVEIVFDMGVEGRQE
jgi:hypothetical protein